MDPQRSAMPDIDIDICQEGRPKVIEYVRNKYGKGGGGVCQIITFNTLGAKAAVKDVGRVLGIPLQETDRITKLIPGGPNISLDDALRIPDIRKLINENPQIARLFQIAERLEGLCRNAGMHAAGVIVCDKPLDTIVPLYKSGEDIMTQWDGPTCEKVGLLKMDFLGLRTLTILERALDLIDKDLASGAVKLPQGCNPPFLKGRGRGHRIDLERIDFTDQHVFQTVFQAGNTKGVFQFESGGMKDLLMKMKPDRVEDLIAANALYRPGPMDLIPDYCLRKHGKQPVPSLHPLADEVLAETYGVMVYQEQVMRIFNRLGNIPLRRAYDIIKAISKKNADKIGKEKAAFVEGAVANGLTQQRAEAIFADIEKFAGYGFNKSHSTRYAIVAYQTAWLKTYFPAQYMAALLTFEMIDQSKTVEYIEECRHLSLPGSTKTGIDILPPDINESDADFTVVTRAAGPAIRFGLAAVKGVGDKAVQSIMEGRRAAGGTASGAAVGTASGAAGGNPRPTDSRLAGIAPFKSIFDFCERVDLRVVNKAVIEALIKCGAFDSLHPIRAAAMAAVENAIHIGQSAQEAKRDGQESLFGGGSAGPAAPQAEPKLNPVPEWPKSERMALEKSVLGFYVTNHPLRDVEHIFSSYVSLDTAGIRHAADRQPATMGGLITKIRPMVTKTGPNAGKKWCILLVEDLAGSIEVTLYTAVYEKFADLLKTDTVLIFEGMVDRSREEPNFRANEVLTLDQAQKKKTREILIQTSSLRLNDATLAALKKILTQHKGGTPVKLELTDLPVTPQVRAEIRIGGNGGSSTSAGVNIHNGAIPALQQLFGESNVLPLGPNRKSRRPAPATLDQPTELPSDAEMELAEA